PGARNGPLCRSPPLIVETALTPRKQKTPPQAVVVAGVVPACTMNGEKGDDRDGGPRGAAMALDDPHKYLDPLARAKGRSLELQARLIVEGYLSGMHKSPYHGFSVEFAQHREYVPGDDIRHVDWKVYGRTGRFFLKQYEEETNLVCWLLVDVSESMAYG